MRFLSVVGLLGLMVGIAWAWRCMTADNDPAPFPRDDGQRASSTPGSNLPPRETARARSSVAEGFVGIEACAECHAARVAEFKTTRHFQACVPPDPDAMPDGFRPGRGAFALERAPDMRFDMTQRGDRFLQTVIRATPTGEHRTTHSIDLVYGAGGGTDEVYFSWTGDQLRELPVAWLHPLNDWGASPFDAVHTDGTGRPLTPQCLECHNTWVEHRPGTLDEYNRHDFLLGVTCERCHGPGRDHIAFHRQHPHTRPGGQVIRPALLSRERQLDLCGQCHSNAVVYRQAPFTYRPGEPLDEYFRVLQTRRPEDDHVANQVQYLRASRCFSESQSLTCTTCHDPHRPAGAEPAAASRQACLSCHEPAHCGEQGHLPEPVREMCVDCHMPQATKLPVSFQTRKSPFYFPVQRCEHRIGVYPAARDQVMRDWYGRQSGSQSQAEAARLDRELAEYWRLAAEDYERQHRLIPAIDAYQQSSKHAATDDMIRRAARLAERQSQFEVGWGLAQQTRNEGRYDAAIEQLRGLLTIKPDAAQVHAELGTLYAVVGKRDLAEEHLQAAIGHDPDSPSAPAMLGWLAYLDGRPEEALKFLRSAEELDPYSAKIQFHIGLALSQLKRWRDARAQLLRVIEIDPRHAGAAQGISEAARQLGQSSEAIQWGEQAADLSGRQDAGILLTLAEAHALAGDVAAARQVARRALEIARAAPQSPAAPIEEFLERTRDALP